jgi:tetratricopeptide (TPR) repeat protein
LARLTTRWATTVEDPARRDELIAQAKDYYQEALSLSPQNSVIRNEYANLLVSLDNDCEAGIDMYEESLAIDPYYYETYFNLAGVYERCAVEVDGEEQAAYYRRAASLLEQGLEQGSRRERNRYLDNEGTLLVQAGQLYQQGAAYEEAIASLTEARQVENARVPDWNIDFQLANVYQAMGDLEQAEALATRALAGAPPEAQGQIETFLAQLSGR